MPQWKPGQLFALSLAPWLLLASRLPSAAESADDWGDEWNLEARVAAVNEGELRFLAPEAVTGQHVHLNRIHIDASSLRTGWVTLEQCHDQLDMVPAAQILFNPERIRHLRVQSADDIGRAWVEGSSVQIEEVGPRARLCVTGESRALSDLGQGRYRLQNGPYMRRFLDGYFPMRVELEIRYPVDSLRFVAPLPAPQPGFEVRPRAGEIQVEATFEGRLYTCMDFLGAGHFGDPGPPPPCPMDQGPVPAQ